MIRTVPTLSIYIKILGGYCLLFTVEICTMYVDFLPSSDVKYHSIAPHIAGMNKTGFLAGIGDMAVSSR